MCFFDSPVSVTLVGRMFATVAEMCLAYQLGLVLHRLGSDLDAASLVDGFLGFPSGRKATHARSCRAIRTLGHVAFPLIGVAQCCCWCGITTTRQIWHGLEESIWAAFAAAMLPALVFIGGRCADLVNAAAEKSSALTAHTLDPLCDSLPVLPSMRTGAPAGLGVTTRFARVGSVCAVLFVIFMVTVDVPMYIERYRADEERGHTYLSFWEGVVDATRCDRVSRDWAVWREDVPWMSAYFTLCVWASLWLAWAAPTLVIVAEDVAANAAIKKK